MFSIDSSSVSSGAKNRAVVGALLFLLLASCSSDEGNGSTKNEDSKKIAAESVAKKSDMISKTIEHLISLQNRINTFKRKHGVLPDMDEFGANYDMWKGRVKFSLLKNNPGYDYMLQSNGPDGKKNTDDDIRIINNLTENKRIRKTVRENSSSENLVEKLGGEDEPTIMSMDELPDRGDGNSGVELSIEDFQKMAGEKAE